MNITPDSRMSRAVSVSTTVKEPLTDVKEKYVFFGI